MGKETEVYEQISEDDHCHIVMSIVHAAARYFEKCPEDFCIQHVAAVSIIFGGTNRLIWSPVSGFRYDEPYCRPEFIAHYKELHGQ